MFFCTCTESFIRGGCLYLGHLRQNESVGYQSLVYIASLQQTWCCCWYLNMAGGSVSVCTECLFKVLVIGERGVGKTSMRFKEEYKASIGVDFALKTIEWDNKTVVRLQLWDIAGKPNMLSTHTHTHTWNNRGLPIYYGWTDVFS